MFHDFSPRVSDRMNETLTGFVSKEEVVEAAFAIKASSAPGADGFTGLFFQKLWPVIGDHVCSEILLFFSSGVFPRERNFTQLCLLPKKEDSQSMADLRPISLCTVFYKIISKILVRWLKPLLSQIVSINQSAFVEEMMISDNILIAHEVVHGLRTHPYISKEFLALLICPRRMIGLNGPFWKLY